MKATDKAEVRAIVQEEIAAAIMRMLPSKLGEASQEAAAAEPPPREEEEEESEETTIDDVRAALRQKATSEGKDAAVAILHEFKAKSVSDLKPSQYKDVIEKAS